MPTSSLPWSRHRALPALILSGFLVSCGGDSPAEPVMDPGSVPTFQALAGAYDGVLEGASEGVTLTATFSLTLVQAQGILSGSFGLSGTLDDGFLQALLQGSGTVTGTVDPGVNPSVSVTMTPDVCPGARVTWAGAYDSGTDLLTISGVANIFNTACVVVLTVPGTMVLSR